LISLEKEKTLFHLTIAGYGNLSKYHSQLNKITNLKIINKKIPDEDVSTYFYQNEIIVLPYREATQSGIISLALSAKIAIIATKVGAFPEILTNRYNSLLVPPNNQLKLQAAIKKLLSNKDLRHKLTVNGSKTIKKHISWNIIVKKYYAVYKLIQ
jgi:glycosyltransferase involved in cell wall biosynthesis